MNNVSPPLAVQLYSVRQDCVRDLAGTLRAIANMGYDGVETAGFAGCSAADFARALAEAGLRVEGAHVGIDAILPDHIGQTIADYEVLGCRRLIVPWIGGPWLADRDGFRRFLAVMNLAADRLADAGIELGYHNHEFEFLFGPGGFFPYQLMAEGFSSKVKFQFDMGLAYAAGADGLALATANPGRICSIHAKPFAKNDPAAYLCEDDVDWKAVVEASVRSGADWVVVEHEVYAADPVECIRRDLDNLRRRLRP